MRGFAVVAVVLAGCVNPSLVDCGDYSCAPELQCDTAHHSCATPDQFAACVDSAQNADCTAGMLTGGCFDGVCIARGCGNNILEPGEMCDDGNQTSNDGCRGDCASDEQCRNGVKDPGETCDDGNARSHDGCDSTCNIEMSQWTEHVLSPSVFTGVTAYDPSRDVIVMLDALHTDRVWELSGDTWSLSIPIPNEHWQSVYFDSETNHIQLLGTIASPPATPYAWDGTTATPGMATRVFHVADSFVDPATKFAYVLSLPDGLAALQYFAGGAWRDQTPPPAEGANAVIGVDPTSGHVIVLSSPATPGGGHAVESELASGWQTAQAPFGEARTWSRMISDPVRHTLVVASTDGLYERAGTTWTKFANSAPGEGLGFTNAANIIYDSLHDHYVEISKSGVVYEWDRSAWKARPQTTPYNARTATTIPGWGIATLQPRTIILLSDPPVQLPAGGNIGYTGISVFGGPGVLFTYGGALSVPQTNTVLWKYDGTAWTQAQDPPAPAPTLSRVGGAVYDPIAKRIIFATNTAFDLSLAGEWIPSNAAPISATSLAWDAGLQTIAAISSPTSQIVDRVGDAWHPTPFTGVDGTLIADPLRASIVLIPINSTTDTRVWERRDGIWAEVDPLPYPVSPAAAAYDDKRGEIVVTATHDDKYVQLRHTWTSVTPTDACAGADDDGDGFVDCEDTDCWWKCTPSCPPETSCP